MTAVGAITDSDPSHYFGAAPGIDIEVSTNGVDADAAPGPYVLVGDAVDWEYLVENTGNLPLSEVAVTDDQGVVVSCPGSDLALGASMTCTASGTAGVGQYANIGTATGMTVVGLATGSDPSHHFGANPDIDIEVFINDDDADTPPGLYIPVGESLTVTFVVTNTGNVPLSDLELTDESVVVAGGIGTASVTSYPLVDSLAVGEVVTISEGPNAVAGGIYSRFVTVTGMSAFGAVSDSDPGYFIGALSRIEIQVYTNGEDADESPGRTS
jgi:hypothetical protein